MDNQAKPVGALLPGIANPSTAGTTSLVPSTEPRELLDLATLPARLDDSTLAMVREIANSPLPAPQRCDDQHFARCMKSLDILPRRADDNGGALRLKLYQAKLGGYSNGALSYLVSKGLEEFHFFPTIAECLKVLAGFPNRDIASNRREKAVTLIRWELQHRMDEWLARLADRTMCQAEVDDAPERWRRVAEAKGRLFACGDGSHMIRPGRALTDAEREEAKRRGGIQGLVEVDAPAGAARQDEAA